MAGVMLIAIIFVISMAIAACGGSAAQPGGSPASSAASSASSATGSPTEGQDYRSIVVQQSKKLQSSLEDLIALLQSPQFKDPQWNAQVTADLNTWSSAYTQAQTLTPPDAYRAFHEKYLSGLTQFKDGADYLQKAIDNQNFSAVDDAVGQMTVAGRTINNASTLLPKQ